MAYNKWSLYITDQKILHRLDFLEGERSACLSSIFKFESEAGDIAEVVAILSAPLRISSTAILKAFER